MSDLGRAISETSKTHDHPMRHAWPKTPKGVAVLRVVDPFETPVSVLEDGTVDVGAQAGSTVRSGDDGVIVAVVPSGVRANVGAVRMSESSKHRGERPYSTIFQPRITCAATHSHLPRRRAQTSV